MTQNARAGLLFSSLNLLSGDVLVYVYSHGFLKLPNCERGPLFCKRNNHFFHTRME